MVCSPGEPCSICLVIAAALGSFVTMSSPAAEAAAAAAASVGSEKGAALVPSALAAVEDVVVGDAVSVVAVRSLPSAARAAKRSISVSAAREALPARSEAITCARAKNLCRSGT